MPTSSPICSGLRWLRGLSVCLCLWPSIGVSADEEAVLLKTALEEAGDNRPQIRRALDETPPGQRSATRFLVAYMPEHDLRTLTADFLLKNVAAAYRAREAMPWGQIIPEERFLNDVLPYASINERRDDWREDFFNRFRPLVEDCQTPGEAAQILNRDLYKLLDVRYHARKRPKPDQSPYESIEAKFASCTGLSILLIDACRAVAVPARFAGTPSWAHKRGNHSWVEVWDDGQWHFTGAHEYSAGGLNKVWFLNDASHAQKASRRHAIYASSWKHTGISFPMIWARDLDFVPAVNVTDHYTNRAEKLLANGECLLGVQVWDRPGGERIVCPVKVTADAGNQLVHEGETTGVDDDSNHLLEVVLKQRSGYTVTVEVPEGEPIARTLTTTNEANQRLDLFLREE